MKKIKTVAHVPDNRFGPHHDTLTASNRTGESREFDKQSPSVQDAMRKAGLMAYDPKADVPVTIDVTDSPNDEELLEQARAIVGDADLMRRSPAMALTKQLLMPQGEPRHETFADLLFAAAKTPHKFLYGFDRKHGSAASRYRQFARWLHDADRFVLDDEFVARAFELSFEPPARLLELALIARAPSERIWIEWDEQARLRTRKLDRKSLTEAGITHNSFDIMGYAINVAADGTHVIEQVGVNKDGVAMNILALAFEPSGTTLPHVLKQTDLRLGTMIETAIQFQMMQPRDTDIKFYGPAHAIGISYMNQHLSDEEQSAVAHLLTRLRYVFGRGIGWTYVSEDLALQNFNAKIENLDRALTESEGDLRLIIAMLALMQSSYTVLDRVTRTEKNAGAKPVLHRPDFYSFSRVRLKLPRERALKTVFDDLGKAIVAHKRRHVCLGHWRERVKTKANGCSHQWESKSPTLMHCPLCGHVRWFVRKHERGDATLGFVHHPEYDVTASGKKVPT